MVEIEGSIESVAARTADRPPSERVAAHRSEVVEPHREVYAPHLVGLPDVAHFEIALDRAIERSLPGPSDPRRTPHAAQIPELVRRCPGPSIAPRGSAKAQGTAADPRPSLATMPFLWGRPAPCALRRPQLRRLASE